MLNKNVWVFALLLHDAALVLNVLAKIWPVHTLSSPLSWSKIISIFTPLVRSVLKNKDSLPLLHYLHLETGHTSTGTRIRNDDLGLADYVRHLARDPNTLTIFLSDHGHTRTDFAQTIEGRFELSNPLMFVILPENVAATLGKDKVRSLVENQRRLFTTLDIHRMLMALNNPVKMKSEDYRINGILSVLPRNRTCENLPLTPLTRCKCEGWDQKVEDNSQKHVWLAEFAIGQLNNMIQEQFMKGMVYDMWFVLWRNNIKSTIVQHYVTDGRPRAIIVNCLKFKRVKLVVSDLFIGWNKILMTFKSKLFCLLFAFLVNNLILFVS